VAIAVYLPLLVAVAVAVIAPPLGRRLSPACAAWSLTLAAVLGAASALASLGLLAWTLVARLPPVAAVGDWRPGAVTASPVPLAIAVIALVALAGIAARLLRWGRDQALEARETLLLERALPTKGAPARLVTVAGERPSAHAVAALPGRGGHVVITSQLLDVLDDPALRRAVVEHERSHLHHHHATIRLLANVAAAVNPLLRRVADEVAFHLERWADEDAARATSPAVTAEALATVSLAGMPGMASLAFGLRGVAGRIDALLSGPPARRPRGTILVAALAALLLLTGIATFRACRSTEALFEGLQRVQRLHQSLRTAAA
jgi:Zn-dependent protease with chaperone function